MFTKYPEIFIRVARNMKGNLSLEGINEEQQDFIISQIVFETLSIVEDNINKKLNS
jgi:hypothetical protein